MWYSFSATQTTMTIAVFPEQRRFGAVIQCSSSACGALTSVACANGFDGDVVQLPLNDLVPGTRTSFAFTTATLRRWTIRLFALRGRGFGITIGIEEQHSVPDAMEYGRIEQRLVHAGHRAPGSLIHWSCAMRPVAWCCMHRCARMQLVTLPVEVALSPGCVHCARERRKDVRMRLAW